ncbi:MAG: glycosyltransferase family 4 protein [Candidatus Symbiothrix sp.]|jgi:glycosyltransferase involved in cell wall biosynthesis|nr:glycosyltransferase family 4 protein [Candidatus Symbiothrix sp.]
MEYQKCKFFYVGRIGYIKGIHLLLEAFAGLDASRCELHIIGDTNEKYAQHLMKQYKKYPNIIFHGKIQPDEVSEYIRLFDILVHPAIYLEVFGLNIGEALLEKKPVIATRCGGAEMQIEDKKNGLLIEPNNVDELQSAMQWILDHPIEIRRMSDNADKHVISMEEHVHTLVELYKNQIKKYNDF